MWALTGFCVLHLKFDVFLMVFIGVRFGKNNVVLVVFLHDTTEKRLDLDQEIVQLFFLTFV